MCIFSVIVNYNTISLNQITAVMPPGTRLMKTQVYDRFGGGLIVLIMLTIAVVAGQAQPDIDDAVAAEDVFELDAGLHISIDRRRLEEFEVLSSIAEMVLDSPMRIEVSIESSETAAADIADPSDSPGQ